MAEEEESLRVQVADEAEAQAQRRPQVADDLLDLLFDLVAGEHVLNVVEQVANGVHHADFGHVVVHLRHNNSRIHHQSSRVKGSSYLLEQLVELDGEVEDALGLVDAEALQGGTDQVAEPEVLLLGADDGVQPLLDKVRQARHLADVGVGEEGVAHGQKQRVRTVQALADDGAKVEQVQRRARVRVPAFICLFQ